MKTFFIVFLLCAYYTLSAQDTISVSSELDERYVLYKDSFKLYSEYLSLKKRLTENNYVKCARTPWNDSGELSMKEIANYVDYGKLPLNPTGRLRYEKKIFCRILPEKFGNLYRVIDFYPLNVNYEVGFQYFSIKIIKNQN